MTFGLLRYSLCTKLKLPIHYQHSFIVNIPRYSTRKSLLNETVRWMSTKSATKETKKLFSESKVLRLYSLAKPEKNRLICAVCFLLVSSAVTMAIPFSFGRIVDIIYKSDVTEAQSKLIKICTILLPVFLIGAACNFGRIYLINTSGYKITKTLRELLFKSLLSQETAYFDRHRTGELINRLSSDCLLVSQTITTNISDGLRSTIMVASGVSFMFFVSPKLALVGLSIVPPIAALAVIYGRFVRKITRSVQAKVTSWLLPKTYVISLPAKHPKNDDDYQMLDSEMPSIDFVQNTITPRQNDMNILNFENMDVEFCFDDPNKYVSNNQHITYYFILKLILLFYFVTMV